MNVDDHDRLLGQVAGLQVAVTALLKALPGPVMDAVHLRLMDVVRQCERSNLPFDKAKGQSAIDIMHDTHRDGTTGTASGPELVSGQFWSGTDDPGSTEVVRLVQGVQSGLVYWLEDPLNELGIPVGPAQSGSVAEFHRWIKDRKAWLIQR